jgi:hypothetical protein
MMSSLLWGFEKDLKILFSCVLPILSSPRLNSGWNMMTIARKPPL